MRALFPGTFDPVTHGHLDLIGRLATLADDVVVGVAVNLAKQPIFTDDERVALLREACQAWPNVTVQSFRGLVVEAARQVEADVIVRGIRAGSEYDHEQQMAQMNRAMTGIETLLLPAGPQWVFISASLVREIARFGGDVSPYVPAAVATRLRAYFQQS